MAAERDAADVVLTPGRGRAGSEDLPRLPLHTPPSGCLDFPSRERHLTSWMSKPGSSLALTATVSANQIPGPVTN